MGDRRYLVKVRNNMSTQSHKKVTKTNGERREVKEDRGSEGKLGETKMEEKKERVLPRKCGTICPRRILRE